MLKRTIVVPPERYFPPDPWRIVERRWTPQFGPRAETALALSNGYLGVRGTPEEGRPCVSPGVLVNGFFESWPIVHPEGAYGLARVGQTILHVPDASVIELSVDDEVFLLTTARLRSYERVLDLRAGTLTRDLVWATPSGVEVRVRSARLVSLSRRHLMAMSYEVTVDVPARVMIRSKVVEWSSVGDVDDGSARSDPRSATRLHRKVLEQAVADEGDGLLALGYRPTGSGMSLGIGVEHVVDHGCSHDWSSFPVAGGWEHTLSTDAVPGVPIRLAKYVAYHSDSDVAPEEVALRCRHSLAGVAADGFDALVASQRRELDRFWDRADVVVEDTVRNATRIQQALRWNVFQLAQATWRAEGTGVPAKGLTGAAYDGHYFWDTDTWVLPFLAYTRPRIARNLLRFRHSMLPKARARAADLHLSGALFPWRTISGDEASANFQAGTAQFHINADIAYAVRHYLDVRGDDGFLAEVGAELLVETARMWADLGFLGHDGRFHLHGVTGPDEYTAVVDDNAYTNLMARSNLRNAAAAVRRLADQQPAAHAGLSSDLGLTWEEVSSWDEIAERMFVPFDDERGITPQDASFLDHERWDLDATPAEEFPLLLHHHPLELYRRQVLKQADVVMAMFLLGDEFTAEQKRRNFAYYDPLTTGDSSLSASIQSVVASEIGDHEAACRYFDFALLMDLADVAGNASDGVHIASAAGAWMAVVFGFGGVRDFEGQLSIDPRLPPRFSAVSFSLRFRDRQVRVHLTHRGEDYRLTEGDPLELVIRGQVHVLEPGVTLHLA